MHWFWLIAWIVCGLAAGVVAEQRGLLHPGWVYMGLTWLIPPALLWVAFRPLPPVEQKPGWYRVDGRLVWWNGRRWSGRAQ